MQIGIFFQTLVWVHTFVWFSHIQPKKMTTFWRGTGVYKVLEIWQICLGKLWPLSIHYPERGWEKQIRPNLENIKRLSFLLINCLQKKEPILWNIFFSLDHNINFASSLIPFSCVWLKCRRQFSEVTLVCWSNQKRLTNKEAHRNSRQ